jgi:predicted  nucleic acid-binding Zn-ribbon protein
MKYIKMNKLNSLQTKLTDIQRTIQELEHIIQEKTETIQHIESQLVVLQENHRAEQLQLDEYTKKLEGYKGLMSETDSYYKQIEQNIDTLMTILATSRS